MTLLKELIDIPEYVHKGDFVLRLSEGVTDAEATVKSYVVTPQLERAFDDALNFIKSALEGRTSKASYLHGSFGSGKSHFMAILHLILQGNATARSIPELARVIDKHNAWTAGKKILLVPYHMIGSYDMESGVLGGYADYVRRVHPEAPVPGVYRAEGLFEDAQRLREAMDDAKFFAQLNEGADGGGWGDLDAAWTPERFDEAVAALPGSEERTKLVGALVRQFFTTYNVQAQHGEAYISLDEGLSVISRHAKELGYDLLLLFLDELILWLASHATDLAFVHRECEKLAKLVEAQKSDRPTPIVSFVARQRDLRELIGDSVPGADRLNFSDALRWQEGRFHTITLEDRNLPAIASRRVLRPKNDAAKKELDAAFEKSTPSREQVMNILLTTEGDRAMFRMIYPFSPALMQTLIAVSSVLQRERTALKVMMQLLVDKRETLSVGDIVPVGDLFDIIAHGDEAFSQEMALHFANATRLYHQKLLPLLEKQHGRWEDLQQLPEDDARRIAFRNDDRIIKTLLLAALVPEVEPLRALTGERLAALNHGTIRSPIPGREGAEVLRRCNNWGASVGELRVGEEATPIISLKLSDVDTESIIQQAIGEDNQGNKVRLIRNMLFTELGIEDASEFYLEHHFFWRNTRRKCELFFRNIRELQFHDLENLGDDWKVIIDWPFDEPGKGPRDDINKLQSFRSQHPEGAKTLAWVPSFFSDDAMKELGLLVILQHVLSGDRFRQYASHLSIQDQQSAKALLDNQRSVLHNKVKQHLYAAYGISQIDRSSLDSLHDLEASEHFSTLAMGFEPQPPPSANLRDALHGFLSQALHYDFPAAPEFGSEVKVSALKKVWEEVQRAAQAADGRSFIEKPMRALLRDIANPLLIGEMGLDATHFVLGQHWKNHFVRKAAETGEEMTVAKLRKWIDEPRPMGLPREAQNLIILTFAEQTSRSFFYYNGPYTASLTDLNDQCSLKEQRLPDQAAWDRAVELAGRVFGTAISPLRNASNVQALNDQVKQRAESAQKGLEGYVQGLQRRLKQFGLNPEDSERFASAQAALALVSALHLGSADRVVDTLAAGKIATSEQAMGDSAGKADRLRNTLEDANWDVIEALGKLTDERSAQAQAILTRLKDTLQRDEHVAALHPAVQEAQAQATRLLIAQPAPPPPPPVEPAPEPEPAPAPKPGKRVVSQGTKPAMPLASARALLDQLEAEKRRDQEVQVTISWTVEEGETKA
jgi:hypothetical protein